MPADTSGDRRVYRITGADREHFLSWDKVASDSLRLSLAPNRLQMNELRIAGLKGQLIIHEDKSLNVQQLMRAPAASA